MREMTWVLFTAVVVADAALTACGGGSSSGDSSSGGACTIAGCGGDLEGTWEITSMTCAKPPGNSMTGVSGCDAVAGEALAGATIDPNGATITFSSGMYAVTGTVHSTLHETYTNDCLTAQQGDPASDATCAMVQSNLATAGFPAKCRFAAPTCVCDVTQDLGVNASGSYRVDGTTLVYDTDKGRAFCVMGDTAQVSVPPAASLIGSVTISRK